jgi:hypothetical protein
VVLVTVHDEDPEPPVMLVGLQVTVSPVAGLTDVVRLTLPANPFWLVIVAVNVSVELPDSGRAAKW